MSGLVQHLRVESDDLDILENVVKILLKWHSSVSHYRTGTDINGVPYLCLMWAAPDGQSNVTPLMAPLKSADSIAHQIWAWLGSVEYGRQPDHDGSNHKGFRAMLHESPVIERRRVGLMTDSGFYDVHDSSFYDFVVIQPVWIEYHK